MSLSNRDNLTSKHAIMIPQAGAILAVRGSMPVNKALMPSVRIICTHSGIVAVVRDDIVPDIRRACRRVFRTSKGEVNNDAVVPLITPHAKAILAPFFPWLSKYRFQLSYPAQYIPLKGTSRHSVGPRPRHRKRTPCVRTSARTEVRTDVSVCGWSGDFGVDCKLVRISSSGERREVREARAVIPAARGMNVGEGISGGSTFRRRWS